MSGFGFIAWIIIGIIAGWLAEKIMKRSHGLLTNLIVGVIGALLGGFLANNLLGLAPGPFITGKLSDLIGLHAAFQFVPLVSIAAAAVFFYARSHYLKDIARLAGERVSDPVNEVACEVKV